MLRHVVRRFGDTLDPPTQSWGHGRRPAALGALSPIAGAACTAASGQSAQDEEDLALSAFDSFCRDTQRARFPRVADRDDLWRLLVTMTAQKSLDPMRREQAH